MNKRFENLVGQSFLINKLNFYLDGYEKNSYFPNTLFLSSKGMGKTEIVRATARELALIAVKKGNKKVFIEINGASLRNVDDFFIKILQPFCSSDNHATLYIDECDSIPKRVVMFLLSVLNPTKNGINKISNNGMTLTIDFTKLTVLMASTESQLIFKALKDRFNEVYLNEYSKEELSQIVLKNLSPGIRVDDDTLLGLASYSRGNGRSAMLLAKNGVNVLTAQSTKKIFAKKDLNTLITKLDLFENGLSRAECELLKMIADSEDSKCSLTALCSKSGLTRAAAMTMENGLLKDGYIEIQGKRGLTPRGFDFLQRNKERLNK